MPIPILDTSEVRKLKGKFPHYEPGLNFGHLAFRDKPKHCQLVGECIMAWTGVETTMAVVLSALMRADNDAAIAVYQTLRRTTARHDSIAEAAKHTLDAEGFTLIKALLFHAKQVELERNKLAHGFFGVCFDIEDGLLCIPQDLAAHIQVDHNKQYFGKPPRRDSDPRIANLRKVTLVYRVKELEQIQERMVILANITA